MFQIHYLNKISQQGTALWTEDFALTDDMETADGIVLRSATMHDMELPENLLAVARAGAGVNNIPLTTCADKGIVVFNTPGANARSVMELTLCGMLLGSRDIIGGVNWVQSIKDDPDISKKVERASPGLPVMRLPARSWVSSDWATSAAPWPTGRESWAWRSTAVTPTSPWRRPGIWTVTFSG